jgi:uncharacterized protein (DUF2237 family)
MPDGSAHRPRPQALNVVGGRLELCSLAPLTGWNRDGCCHTDERDHGSHTVCAVVTAEFLAFSRERGNDLSTPRPDYAFPGLKPGDSWCLCAMRWEEARQAGCAPLVRLTATHQAALRYCQLLDLQAHAA